MLASLEPMAGRCEHRTKWSARTCGTISSMGTFSSGSDICDMSTKRWPPNNDERSLCNGLRQRRAMRRMLAGRYRGRLGEDFEEGLGADHVAGDEPIDPGHVLLLLTELDAVGQVLDDLR